MNLQKVQGGVEPAKSTTGEVSVIEDYVWDRREYIYDWFNMQLSGELLQNRIAKIFAMHVISIFVNASIWSTIIQFKKMIIFSVKISTLENDNVSWEKYIKESNKEETNWLLANNLIFWSLYIFILKSETFVISY